MLLSLKLLLSVLLLLLTHVPGAQAAEPPTTALSSDSASASTGNSTLSPSQAEGIATKGIAAKVTGPEISGYSQMREIGYQIGDIATQTIHATTPVGYSLDRSSLPVLGEVGASLQLLSADYRQYASGTKHTLRLRWQSFRAMQEIRSYALLPLRLQFRNGDKVLELALKAPSILVASTLPTVMDSKHALLQPAVKPAPIATHSIKQQLLVSLGLLAIALSYLLWRYDWWPFKRKKAPPFRQAWRQLNRHSQLRLHFLVDDEAVKHETVNHESAQNELSQHVSMQMRILRRAFDNSLGAALSAERLPLLYQQLPWLLPLQTEIDAFFAESERVFFSGDKSPHKPTYKPRYKPRHDRQHASDNYTVALSRRLMLLESDAA